MGKYPTLKGNDGKDFTLVIDQFGKGTMTLYDETRLPREAVYSARNMYLDQDGVWTTRPGTTPYGAALTSPIDGACSFVKYNSDGTTDTYIGVVDNGAFKVSQDGGSWSTISGVTWTKGKNAVFKQDNARLYIANGKDTLAYYDIAASTLNTFSSLSSPDNVAASRTGLSAGSYNAYYKVTAINNIGETIASSEASVSGGINKMRDNWEQGTDSISVSWDAVSGADRYNIYYSDASNTQVWLDSSSTNAYVDTGIATPNIYQEAPTTDTTGGPAFGLLALSDNRLWGGKDPDQPYRVSWAGVGQYKGYFNPYYGGGYIDLNKGGDERPESIVHFRDGKGNDVTTVLTSNPNGTGSTWHITLSTLTVDTLTVVIPTATQQQGSVGTRSPRGVVEYNNSIYFPSPKGIHSIGSRQSILNVLVTEDMSSNNRGYIQDINNAYAHMICGYALGGRIYWSVPYGTSTNNRTIVMDVERNNAWALDWSIGVKQFFEYTDSSGAIRFLGVPTSGTRLVEFTNGVSGDSGAAFPTNLESGLIHWDDDHTTWAQIKKVYIEVANAKGSFTFSVSGTQKGKSFRALGSINITDSLSDNGWSSDLWSDVLWGDTNNTGTSFTQLSTKKVLKINKLLSNLRWKFSSTDINTSYTPMQIVIKGTIIPTSDPSEYRR